MFWKARLANRISPVCASATCNGRIQAVDDGDETLMRPLQFDAHPFGLGDVVHRGHPADLLAVGVDERREVEADIETLAVLAHDAHLETALRRLAGQPVSMLRCNWSNSSSGQ